MLNCCELSNSHNVESDTVWHDDTTSFVRIEKFRPTQKVTVERMEYRDGPAAVYPIHHIRTGIVVDLSDQRYWFHASTTKEPHSLNTIIIDADNDGWEWTGSSNRGAQVTFAPGEDPVDCRPVRYDCRGAYACDRLDPALRSTVRFELDPASRDAIIAAQQETRRKEGNTAEERAVLFIKVVCNTKCSAVDSNGTKCRGGPIMKPKPQPSYDQVTAHLPFANRFGFFTHRRRIGAKTSTGFRLGIGNRGFELRSGGRPILDFAFDIRGDVEMRGWSCVMCRLDVSTIFADVRVVDILVGR
ncbi:hypothetical protein B0H10DRAFT_2201490 [Mycena sp. CBHHK59/15]|nr:hypothetical protein B0H10DRAFT_2201490 [Mycena sp. CBHHK59/15]